MMIIVAGATNTTISDFFSANILYLVGGGACVVLIGSMLVGSFVLFDRRKRQTHSLGEADQRGPIQDEQGNWWYQDFETGGWSFWDGQAWQATPGAPSGIPPASRHLLSAKPRAKGSCLFSLIASVVIGLVVIGGISLVSLNFFPAYQITMGQGDINQILKMGGGGLLAAALGLLLLNGGFKTVITRRAIIEDDWGRQHEKRGCSAILNGLGQLFFAIVCLAGGLGLITLTFYQEILPWLGF